MHEAKETGRSSIMQGRIVTRSGKIRHLTITFSYMDGKDSEDGIPSYYSLGIDVTETVERQRLQQQALEDACRVAKHANQGKTEFLSRMSHDIRTPMNAIVGMTAIAGTHIEDTQKVRDCLKKINTSSKHLLNLINEVWICPNRERTLGCAGERFQPFQSGAERVRRVQADDH